MKHLRWDREAPAPRHPYRDTAFLYAVFAGIIVLVTAVTSGNLLPGNSNRRHGVLRFVAEIGAVPAGEVARRSGPSIPGRKRLCRLPVR